MFLLEGGGGDGFFLFFFWLFLSLVLLFWGFIICFLFCFFFSSFFFSFFLCIEVTFGQSLIDDRQCYISLEALEINCLLMLKMHKKQNTNIGITCVRDFIIS